MKLYHAIILLCVLIICLGAFVAPGVEQMAKGQTPPPDVGLVTRLSGEITYWSEGDQKPVKAQAFMKIRKGDRFKLPAGALIQLVYFLGGRQETWKGPVTFAASDSESYTEGKKGSQILPKVVVLPARTTQGVRRIPVLLRRAGLWRPGAAQIRGDVETSQAALVLTPEEKAEIVAAKETYRSIRKQTNADDITPELYLLGVLTDYEQYTEMEGIIREALKRQPENDILKGLMEWVLAQESQPKGPPTK